MNGQVIATVAGVLGLTLPVALAETQAEISEATKAQVIEAIESYVERDSRVKEAFLLLDPRSGEPIRLSLDHVHEGVEAHEQGYVACVDFKDGAGRLYDVDIVVGKSAPMEIAKAFLHKAEGKAVTPK